MECGIGSRIVLGLVIGEARFNASPQFAMFGCVHSFCTVVGTESFELRHHLEYLKQLFESNLDHEAARPRLHLNEPEGCKSAYCLTDRCSRDAETECQRALIKAIAGQQCAGEDLVLDNASDRIA